MRINQRAGKTGFTLVEILVVLAVLGVLAALLFAVFSRVRENGRRTVCQSNLRQIAVAMQQYVQDNDGRYPSMVYVLNENTPTAKAIYWYDAIMPYVKNDDIFRCPTCRMKKPTDYVYNWPQVNDIMWDRINNKLVGSHESSRSHNPSTTWLHVDEGWQDSSGNYSRTTANTSCGPTDYPNLHSGGANYSFLDGHVKWLSPEQAGEMECASEQSSNP